VITLSVKEASALERQLLNVTGKRASWTRLVGRMQTKICRVHKLEMQACGNGWTEGDDPGESCRGAPCERHAAAIESCDDCLGPDLSAEEWAALDWVLRRRSDPDAGEPELRDGRVHHAHGAEFVEQSARNLVRAVVFRDFLAHEEYAVVVLHLLAERLVQGVTVCNDGHVGR